ncbi:MAG TPA: hypothetical protein VFS43_45185 [Polyangiaceae bacterium]|nr:hypothetical protein [Polyangiaceae bacterium]
MSFEIPDICGVALATALAGLGCGHVESHAVAFDRRAASPADVTVYAASAPPPGQPLGEVVARGRAKDDVSRLYGELVRKTQALGGNVLVIESMGAQVEERSNLYTGLPSAHDCGASCGSGGDDLKSARETVTVELRGKAMRVDPNEIAPPADRGAP